MKSYTDELVPPIISDTPVTVGADFGIRFLARFLDLIYGYLLAIGTMFFGGFCLAVLSATGHVSKDWVQHVQQARPIDYVLALLGFYLYHSFTDGISGTSIGKLVCGLNVVQMDGRPCSMTGAFKRDLAYYMDGLFFGLVGYESMKKTPLRQRYGDVWGKTIVVKKADFLPRPKHSTGRLVTGILLGSLAVMAVQLTGLLSKVL